VIDCLADQYDKIERSLPKTAAYKELRQILDTTGSRLQSTAQKYSYGATAETIRRPAPGMFTTRATRALIPVPETARNVASKIARRAVAEAATLLLRSAEQSTARRAPFQRIAAALGTSNKVLLRT